MITSKADQHTPAIGALSNRIDYHTAINRSATHSKSNYVTMLYFVIVHPVQLSKLGEWKHLPPLISLQ